MMIEETNGNKLQKKIRKGKFSKRVGRKKKKDLRFR